MPGTALTNRDKPRDLVAAKEATKSLRFALATAKSTGNVTRIRNQAEAIRTYAKLAKDRTLEIDAAEIRIRSERRLGQVMNLQRETFGLARGAAEKGVGRRGKRGSRADPHSRKLTLADVNIDKHLADEARKLAALTETDFEQRLTVWRKQVEAASRTITVKLFNSGRKKSSATQMLLLEASSTHLSSSGRDLEHLLLEDGHAASVHKLNATTIEIIEALVSGIRRLEKSAQRIAEPGNVERFQADFAEMERKVIKLAQEYRAVKVMMDQWRKEDHALMADFDSTA